MLLRGSGRLAALAVSYHPDSKAARAAGRLTYLAAAIASESLDYVSIGSTFQTSKEHRRVILDAVRLGALSGYAGQNALKLALALVKKYAPGGQGTAATIEASVKRDLENIPADIVADQATKLLTSNELFSVGRELEMASYKVSLPTFDELGAVSKSMLGALLDYASVDRERFAHAWNTGLEKRIANSDSEESSNDDAQQSNLFNDR